MFQSQLLFHLFSCHSFPFSSLSPSLLTALHTQLLAAEKLGLSISRHKLRLMLMPMLMLLLLVLMLLLLMQKNHKLIKELLGSFDWLIKLI